jgi:DNA-binding MarR family transcriptional regulator
MDSGAEASQDGVAPLTISRPELLVNGSDRAFRRLVDSFFAFAARHHEIREGHAARIGLTGTEYTTLVALRHLQDEGGVSVVMLADYFRVSGSFVTTVAGHLVRKGLVDKAPDLEDRRRVRLRVTAKGEGLLAELAPVQRQVNNVEFGCLSREEFETQLKLLQRLIRSSDQAIALQRFLALAPDERAPPL